MSKLTDEMRAAAVSLRRKSMPLSELIPLLTTAASTIDDAIRETDELRARLAKAKEIMEVNDPWNARELFGEPPP